MSAKLLDGTSVARLVIQDVAERVAALRLRGMTPALAAILVGDDPASVGYVRKKQEACVQAGLRFVHVQLGATTTQDELHATIRRLNSDSSVHGLILQYPLPPPLDFGRALEELDPRKDADGLHATNIGRLAAGIPGPIPATPAAVRAMLLHYGIRTSGRHVVILGRGPTLGRPLSLLLSGKGAGADAAVTVLHSGVPELAHHTVRADILISGVGQPGLVKPDMVREGAVVISAGISWNGKRLLADVEESVGERASWITPRLGGVGVMTVAMLLENTVRLAEKE